MTRKKKRPPLMKKLRKKSRKPRTIIRMKKTPRL